MSAQKTKTLEAQKAAAAFLRRPKPCFKAWRAAKLEEDLKNAQPGQTIGKKGIYVGTWAPKDKSGKSLGKTFNIFAAPQDLTDRAGNRVLLTFNEAVKSLSGLKDWHGHDGGNFENDTALYNALKSGSYKGEWFIPTRDILGETRTIKKKDQPNTLYQYKDTGDLKDTLVTTDDSDDAPWHWSCTEDPDDKHCVRNTCFSDGRSEWTHKDLVQLSCRPVRAELKL